MRIESNNMKPTSEQRRKILSRTWFYLLLINLLIISLVVVSLYQSRMLYKDRAVVSTGNMARLLTENIDATLDKIDLCLHTVKREAEIHLTGNDLTGQKIDPFIRDVFSFLPELESIRITDSRGNVIISTGTFKSVNNSDRDYFSRLRDDPKLEMVIARPVVGRIAGKWVMSFARRLNYPDGSFAGVVYAQLTLAHFSKLFSTVDIGKNAHISLRDGDLSLIVRHPNSDDPGNSIGSRQLSPEFTKMVAANAVEGSYRTDKSEKDGIPHTVSYQRSAHFPLYVIVERSTGDYLAGWKSDFAKSLILLSIFVVTTIVAAWLLYASWLKQMQANEELRRSRNELEIRVAERTGELELLNTELHGKTTELEQEIAERQIAQEALAVKNLQVEEVNRTLEERVQNSVTKLRAMDSIMIQQSRQAAMGEMINNIAHQWKQPLNNLGLVIQSIGYEFNAGMLTREELELEVTKCMDLVSFMSQTIDDFRSFFLADKQKTVFGIRQSISRAIRLISASLKDHNIKIVVEPGEEQLAEGFPNEYAQVLMNLLGNARGVLLERQIVDPVITVKVTSEEERAVVSINDNGGGISEDIIGSIFNPYFTTKKQGEGTGIGLFMSKTIIEEHMGGNLTVCNIDGGACFKVAIRLNKEPESSN